MRIPFNPRRAAEVGLSSVSSDDLELLRERLWRSSLEDDDPASALAWLAGWLAEAERNNELTLNLVPLETLDGWRFIEDGFLPDDPEVGFDLCRRTIATDHRQHSSWHQPFLRGTKLLRAVLLLCKFKDGIAVFLRGAREPGFGLRMQFGPSWQSDSENPQWIESALSESRP